LQPSCGKYNLLCRFITKNSRAVDYNREDTNAEKILVKVGIQIYMGIFELPEFQDYFQGDICV